MNIKKAIIFLLFTYILSSCATLKSDKFIEGQIKLTKDNIKLLNGKYSRASINQSENQEGDLFWSFYTRAFNVGADSLCFVNLTIVDEEHLSVSLLKKDSLIKSRILEGKIEDGYFEMRRRYFIVPGLFFNICRTTKFRIGLLDNNNITTDYREIAYGTGFFIIPFYNRDRESDFEYKRY